MAHQKGVSPVEKLLMESFCTFTPTQGCSHGYDDRTTGTFLFLGTFSHLAIRLKGIYLRKVLLWY